MFIFGTPAEMKDRLEQFVAGGVTTPILTPVVPPEKLAETIDALAR
jgi:alkanesulfonate monooxygenase SsuD/methylene tetrahydromethanopterin reductase-like flavin-dependent oxidoreductase (luciferase family)